MTLLFSKKIWLLMRETEVDSIRGGEQRREEGYEVFTHGEENEMNVQIRRAKS